MLLRMIKDALPDKLFIQLKYRKKLGKRLNLKQPQTFNEKMQWLKLYDRKPIYITMVDKYEVKKYVADIIGEEYIIPTYGVWDHFDDIDFDSLPNSFVLKCTHDSGGLVIVKNKPELDMKAAKEKIEESLKFNYFYLGREWPYKNVKPRIIAEKLMTEADDTTLIDYKLMCFDGKVKCTFVCSERFSQTGLKITIYDREWAEMPLEIRYHHRDPSLQKPVNYEKMVELAEILAKGRPFIRVDFYEIDNKIYFSELTFFPDNGLEQFEPENYDYTLGSWITLPEKYR